MGIVKKKQKKASTRKQKGKLAVNATFEELVAISVSGNPKPKKKAS